MTAKKKQGRSRQTAMGDAVTALASATDALNRAIDALREAGERGEWADRAEDARNRAEGLCATVAAVYEAEARR